FELVHGGNQRRLSTGLIEVARTRAIPSILTLHDYWLVCQRGQMLQPDLTLCSEPEDIKCARCLAPYIEPYLVPAPGGLKASGRLPLRLSQAARGLVRLVSRASARVRPPQAHDRAVEHVRWRTRHVHQVMHQADLLLTPSHFHRAQFVRFGVDPEQIKVQYNGMRVEFFADRRPVTDDAISGTEGASHTRDVHFCFLGTIIPSKGVHVLLEAFGGLHDEHARLDVHGWAPAYEGFPDYARNLESAADSRVYFHGGYDNSDVAAILAGADVVVIPSIWNESASMIAHEAFLARKPVIASRLGALAEFVRHEENGLLFEPRNVADLRAQMARLLADPTLRDRLARNPGPVRTVEDQAVELEAIYQDLIRGAADAVS
ncbi:MAG: glycosyltransferase, partial [Anaerolineae bacterium]